MSAPTPLSAAEVAGSCDPESLGFKTTDELEDLTEIIGQARATEAVRFGIGIQREGYNLYVMGPSGVGKHSMVREYLQPKAAQEVTPPDWCYVNNFDQPHRPKALRLPAGTGDRLANDMQQLVEELSTALPAVFESEEYREQLQTLEHKLKEEQEAAFNRLSEHATAQDIKLFRTPSGFAFAPIREGEVIGPEEYEKLPKEEQAKIEKIVAKLQEELQEILKQIPQMRKSAREKINELNRSVARTAVGHSIDALRDHYDNLPEVQQHLDAVEEDVVNNVKSFLKSEEGDNNPLQENQASHRRYLVNVLVDNSEVEGAPVHYLDNPSYANLIGRTEHMAQFGTLVTDFKLIKAGAMHSANGGYLMLDAQKLLTQPYAWEGLKRALYSSEICIEPLEKMLGLLSTVSLEPEPIQLHLKVILLGDRMLYYLLQEYDSDFAELFKVQADFENEMPRSDENNRLYAQMIATLARKEGLRPFDNIAVARVLDYASRHVEDTKKLTTHMRSIMDLLREADHWADEHGNGVIRGDDIEKALEHQRYRASRIREQVQESIRRGEIFIDTSGAKVGQINGLSVISLGDHSFGEPSRITATVHLGEGHVIDIEREVELSGAIHSKGVMILSAFIAHRFAQKQPLSLSANLVFEQSYGKIDGDSASMAELCALLSAVAGVPIKQSFAMTGSVNQFGEMQPIGGVNEKIEGFFDVCSARGLNGEHGVLIPKSNVEHLILRSDIVAAVEAGKFTIYAIEHLDQALELLMEMPAGEADAEGNYPEQSINGKVAARLREMSELRQQFGEHGDKCSGDEDDKHESKQ